MSEDRDPRQSLFPLPTTEDDSNYAPTLPALLEEIGVLPPVELSGGPPQELARIDRFVVSEEIGRGGMGRVVAAYDPDLGRSVAIKLLRPRSRRRQDLLSRFVSEARITAQLQHPNIIPVHEIGMCEGEVYFVMKRVEGRSLRQVLDRVKRGEGDPEWSQHRLLLAFVQVAHALAYAHSRAVIHRDVKPENVMVGRFGEVLLLDWGVARILEQTLPEEEEPTVSEAVSGMTVAGQALGTPGYMSPEQARGEVHDLDSRSDVFSLGLVLYEILTQSRAYNQAAVTDRVSTVSRRSPEDPRDRAPEQRIPAEIAEICNRALAHRKRDRYATASELAGAVSDYLEGSRRREAAGVHLRAADEAWERWRALQSRHEELETTERRLAAELKPWDSLQAKTELLAVRKRMVELVAERTEEFSGAVAGCDQALSQDPGNLEARQRLARIHYARFEEAEASRSDDATFFRARVAAYDDAGDYAERLAGLGTLSLRTEPSGAEVLCQAVDQHGFVWESGPVSSLGSTPLSRAPLAPGSYVITLRAKGCADTVYPVWIPRGHDWDCGPTPVPLLREDEIGPGFVYVPQGRFLAESRSGAQQGWSELGGFLITRDPVTVEEYCTFLNVLKARDPDEAWTRVPRQGVGTRSTGGQYWDRPGPGMDYCPPAPDRDGDFWDPEWPAMGMSWGDAAAYAAWRAREVGKPIGLPSSLQWEKAARGVDGRTYPWGDGFDPALCRMRDSRADGRDMEPVGAYPTDCSVYGVRDLAGGVRDWCSDEIPSELGPRRVVRGGSWASSSEHCRISTCVFEGEQTPNANVGFRLAMPLAAPGSGS